MIVWHVRDNMLEFGEVYEIDSLLTIEEYNEMYRKQESKCGICGIHENQLTKKLNIDHDHKTGKARELLCQKCNVALSYFENFDIKPFIEYLKKHKEKLN